MKNRQSAIIDAEFTVVGEATPKPLPPPPVQKPKTWADAITAIIVVAIIRAIVTHFIHT